jgi:GntR family transcriptional regulator / MocR family aminotransferase
MRGIAVDRSSTVSLQRQLESALRDAILSGRMKAGERILSSRELQTHLGLSRNTIVAALGQLYAEGYLEIVRGVGTFVAETLQHRPRETKPARARERPIVPSETARAFLSIADLAINLGGAVPFRPGIPALDLFPSVQFKRAFSARQWNPTVLDYQKTTFGDEHLREALVKRLQQTRGLSCTADQVMIVGGAQAAFSLIARVLLRRNESAVIEEPGYQSVRAIFLSEGATIVPAPVDESGISVASFARRSVKLVHTTPSHQYPTGAVMSLERRFALLEWAAKRDAWIVEDDYDSEFNYTGRSQPALHSLSDDHRVLYVGTFSKVLSPALRMAYVIVPRSLVAAFEGVQRVIGGQPSGLLQNALAAFIEDGYFGRHIAKMRRVYDDRRQFTSAQLADTLGPAARVRDSAAGLHFIVQLPKTIDDAEFSARAAEKGIIVPALSSYFYGRPTLNGIVVGYAASSIAAAKTAIGILAQLV